MSAEIRTLVWSDGAPADQAAALLVAASGDSVRSVEAAVCALFGQPNAALGAALALVERVGATVRVALHTGEIGDGTEAGATFNRAAELVAAGHGGQIILSAAVAGALRADGGVPTNVELHDLGVYRLEAGLGETGAVERVFEARAVGAGADFPALRLERAVMPEPGAPRVATLPVPLTPLLGRDREVSDLTALLSGGEARLVTLTGPGGTGKTRLALEVAARSAAAYADGVRFVALAAATTPVEVLSKLAEALTVPETGAGPLAIRLRSALHDRRMLVVLDNFEQALSAATLVEDLLSGAAGLHVLVTSRAPLDLYGEHRFPVGPLGLPDPAAPNDPASWLASPAVALFVARARAAEPTFRLAADNGADVAGLCDLLDGLPLAIELAAARIRQLKPDQMLAALRDRPDDGRLTLLDGGVPQRGRPARQQTLRGAVGWSYDLLDPPGQRLFSRLGVVICGATADAAARISGRPIDEVRAGLDDLVNQSLLLRKDDPPGERFVMLETIREYAVEQLRADGGEPDARRALGAYLLDWADEIAPKLVGVDQAEALDEVGAEHDNCLSTLAFWLDGADDAAEPVEALRLSGAIWRFWYSRGHLREGRRWLERSLERCPTVGGRVRAVALGGLGRLTYELGDYPTARQSFEAERSLSRADGDLSGEAEALYGLGVLSHSTGDLPAAKAFFSAALSRYQTLDDPDGTTSALRGMGVVSLTEGDYAQAAALLEGSLALFRALGNSRDVALVLANLGRAVTLGAQDYPRAAALLVEGIELSLRTGNQVGLLGCLERMAELETARGRGEPGARFGGAAEALRDRLSAPLSTIGQAFHRRLIEDLRRLLPADLFAGSWAAGRGLSTAELLALARA